MNPMFRRIDDFEFTAELAVFDRLDIPLYHGWIVDPKDTETATAIGSKSYNALVAGIAEFRSVVHEAHKGRGDREEAAELASALNQSKAESGLLLTYHIAILHPPNKHRKVRGMRVLLNCLTRSSKAVLPLMTRQRNISTARKHGHILKSYMKTNTNVTG
ncbi:uncharacterized protein [Miscanthus floridulus]